MLIFIYSLILPGTAGFLYNYINRQMCLIIMTVITGAATALMPFCSKVWLLYVCYFTVFAGSGVLFTSSTAWVIEMWADRSAPVLMLMGFMYGLGNILAPILDRPYLTGELTLWAANSPTNGTLNNALNDRVDRRSLLAVPYIISGCLCVPGNTVGSVCRIK